LGSVVAGWLGIIGAVTKDRTRRRELARDVQIAVERSSTHPVEYAIVLLVERDGVWHTVCTFDNAHAPDEHHEHRYVGSDKQPPVVSHGPPNDAMHAAEIKLLTSWSDIVRNWESTR
jgi:hypothetical protein